MEAKVRVHIKIPKSEYYTAKALADTRNVTFTEVVRGALTTERYLRDAQKAGKRIFIEDTDGKIQELVFI